MNISKNLEFRRQFLFSASRCDELATWHFKNLDSHFLYVHPDVEFNSFVNEDVELYMIGYAINPHFPEKSSIHVLKDISSFDSINNIPELLYNLVGRFVLLIKKNKEYTFFHDACGLRQLYYTKYENKLYAASQPLLLKLVIGIKESANCNLYMQSQYVKLNNEHWLPSGISLYDGVYQLIPNHYVDSVFFKQTRYWPNCKLQKKDIEDSVEKIAYVLKQTMFAANNRFQLALPLTAGKDSRIILSACQEILKDIFVYTLQYRSLNEFSGDIRIPQKLAERLGFEHKLIDCRKPLNKKFVSIYLGNSDIAHLYDWGIIANGMFSEYPQKRVAIKGSCVEIGRCVYYKLGKHSEIKSSSRFHTLINGWGQMDFLKKRISEWFEDVKECNVNYGYDLFDLFYWEHRMGSWQAQSQLEWDIVQEEFTPFNNREIIDIMLAVHPKYRIAPNFLLFTKIIEKLWPEVLLEKINPKTISNKLKIRIKNILIYTGIYYGITQRIYQRIKKPYKK